MELSIIVPVLNGENTISKCFDSILNQTFKDYEVIVVDAESTDNTANIVKEYILKDSRIKYIKSPLGGTMNQINYAINKTQGKYIGFVDCDDIISSDMYEFLINNAHKNDADISTCGILYFQDYGDPNEMCKDKHDGRSILKGFYSDKLYKKKVMPDVLLSAGSVSKDTKIFKREILINATKYYNSDNYTRLWEDTILNYAAFCFANSVYISDDVKYCYIQHQNSTTHKKHTENMFDVHSQITKTHIEIFLETNNKKYINQIYTYPMLGICTYCDNVFFPKSSYKNKRKLYIKIFEYDNNIKAIYKSNLLHYEFSFYHKILIVLLRIRGFLFIYLWYKILSKRQQNIN